MHTDDVATAFAEALVRDVTGAFNLAAEPVLDGPALAAAFGVRAATVPLLVVRAFADVSYRLHAQPTDAGWIDMASQTPLMDPARARAELEWTPTRTSVEAVVDVAGGIHDRATGPTPVLR